MIYSKMKEITVIAVVLILSSIQAEARREGAPVTACSTLVPNHAPNQADDDPFPYEVNISTFALSPQGFGYEGGKTYQSKPYS